MTIVFGPVPSRRLGRSLGINNIPPKKCSYSCVYCQVGGTITHSIDLRNYHPVEEIVAEISARVREIRNRGEKLDFLTFVPDGEPTLGLERRSKASGGWESAFRSSPTGIPTRPTAENWAASASEEIVTRAHHEGAAFGTSGDPEKDLLSITAVHPMREDAVRELFRGSKTPWAVVARLTERGDIKRARYRDQWFYVRRFGAVE